MRLERIGANVVCFGASMSACGLCGEWKQVIELLSQMRSTLVEPNIVVCNTAISACSNSMEWQHA
eukprot:5421964-Pyramimonas_sp.AAC.1